MPELELVTERLVLVLQSPENLRRKITSLPAEVKKELSLQWLQLVENAKKADPWIHGFDVTLKTTRAPIGQAGFKSPPNEDGVVEIAYGIDELHQGNGYATEATLGLTSFALEQANVRKVRAHTLPQENASTKVLRKCKFIKIDEVEDPDDGPVWRWEYQPKRA